MKVVIFIIFLFCLSIFLRFYNLSNIYIFGFDEEYYATYAWTLVSNPHPIWIGGSASFLDYYLGPYFTYFTAILLWISRGDPLFTGYVAAFFGAVTSIVIFFVGWRFFNLTAGVLASLLHTGLPLIVFYDQKYWNPMFVQLIVLLMFTSLMLVKKTPWWWLLFSALVGIIFNTDLAPLPFALIGLAYFLKGRYFLNKKILLSCMLVFLLFYWPLMVFDYYHNFSNLTVLSRYNKQARESGAKFDPADKMRSFFDTMGRYWYLEKGRPNADELNIFCNIERTIPSKYISFLSISLLILFFIVSFVSRNQAYILLSIFLSVAVGSYLIYTGGSFEYYLLGLMTLFTFIGPILISHISNRIKPLLLFLVVVVLAVGFHTVINSSDKYGLGSKKRLIEKVMLIVGDNHFSVKDKGICHTYEGWRYLFKAYGRTPTESFTDKHLAWLYPKELSNEEVEYEVLLSQKEVSSDQAMTGYIKIEEGGFAAYIKKIR